MRAHETVLGHQHYAGKKKNFQTQIKKKEGEINTALQNAEQWGNLAGGKKNQMRE